MNERDVLARLRAANPVSHRATVADHVGEADLLVSIERRDEMPTSVKTDGSDAIRIGRGSRGPALAAGFAAVIVAVGVLGGWVLRGPAVPFASDGVPDPHARTIAAVVDAYNERDLDGFRSLFVADGLVPTYIGHDPRPGPDDVAALGVDFGWADALDHRLEVERCETDEFFDVRCRVIGRWQVLRHAEVVEYQFDFSDSGAIRAIGLSFTDEDPTAPDGWLDSAEYDAFHTWLDGRSEADQLVPRDLTFVEVGGVMVGSSTVGFFPDPDNVDEIVALLEEWESSR